MQNGQLWIEYYDLGLERCAFTSRIRCSNPHVRAMTGCRDIQKIVETPDIVVPHMGAHSHDKEIPQLVGLKAPENASRMQVVSCKCAQN